MLSFEYNGQSTDTIVDQPLMIVTFEAPNEIAGFSREIVKGDKTMLHQEVNHYGTMYSDDSTYEFYLVKKDGSGFTNTEQRKINKWLTSPTLPKRLKGIGDDKEELIYKGIFQHIDWKLITCKTGKLDSVKCTFVCDTPFIWQPKKQTYNVDNFQAINLTIDSDDSEYRIYPKITIKTQSEQTITILHKGTNYKMSVHCRPNLTVCLDCKYCRVTDGTVTGAVSFTDIGWTNAEGLQWLYLIDGPNILNISGSCTVDIEYDVPIKRIGDLL